MTWGLNCRGVERRAVDYDNISKGLNDMLNGHEEPIFVNTVFVDAWSRG